MLKKLFFKATVAKRLPKPQGPHHVGSFDFMTDYSPDGVFFRLYYPTKQETTQLQVKWIPDDKYIDGLARFSRVFPGFFRLVFRLVIGDVYLPVTWDAPTLRQKNGWPLVIFSHGLGGCRTTYSTACTEIASQGFVVAAAEHRDQTACLSYYLKNDATNENVSKEWIEYRRMDPQEKAYPIRNGQVHKRAQECVKTLNILLKLNKGLEVANSLVPGQDCSLFNKLIDESKVAIVGHSFGGATIVPTLAQDSRFKLGVALDAWMYPIRLEEMSNFNQPMLLVNMERFQTPVNVATMKKLGGVEHRQIVTLKDGSHQNASDTPFLSDNPRIWSLMQSSKLPPLLAMNIITALTVKFLRTHLGIKENNDYTKTLDDNAHLLVTESLSITSKY